MFKYRTTWAIPFFTEPRFDSSNFTDLGFCFGHKFFNFIQMFCHQFYIFAAQIEYGCNFFIAFSKIQDSPIDITSIFKYKKKLLTYLILLYTIVLQMQIVGEAWLNLVLKMLHHMHFHKSTYLLVTFRLIPEKLFKKPYWNHLSWKRKLQPSIRTSAFNLISNLIIGMDTPGEVS